MGNAHRIRGVVAALAALGLGGGACVAKRVPVHEPTATAAPTAYDFEREGQVPPPPAVVPAPASGRAESTAVNLDTPVAADLKPPPVDVQELAPPVAASPAAAPAPAPAAPPPAAATVPGYRVQVFAGADRDAAERVRREVESRLGDRAYVVFEPPYYKVRVGDCRAQEACRILETRLRQAGYASIWLVRTPIEP